MICAIYARKSNEQISVADAEKSVSRQIEHARAYAERKGWTITGEHVYVDDGVSGALFGEKRPGLARLLGALQPQSPFQILVTSEVSRFGRESIETAWAMKRITDAGVKIFDYLADREWKLDNATDKIMLSLANFASEVERERGAQRTHDALKRRAEAGVVANGIAFGYRNEPVVGPDGKRQHSVRVVEPGEAAIVARIFQLAGDGAGYRRIAYTLNAEGAPAPSPRRPGRAPSWSSTTVRDALNRETYRGLVTWNRRRRDIRHGKRAVSLRPENQWIRREAPELRIISDSLWQRAHERLAATRATYLAATNGVAFAGRPIPGTESAYLLTGMASCGVCTGTMFAHRHGHQDREFFSYLCTRHHTRGRSVCSNGLEAAMPLADAAVIQAVEHDLLNVPVLETALAKALTLQAEPDDDGRLPGLRKELARLDREVARLAAAIASGGSMESLLGALQARERERTHVRSSIAEIEHQRGRERAPQDMLKALRAALADLKATLHGAVGPARQVLRSLLAARLTFTPVEREGERFYTFTAPGNVSPVIAGVLPMACASRWC